MKKYRIVIVLAAFSFLIMSSSCKARAAPFYSDYSVFNLSIPEPSALKKSHSDTENTVNNSSASILYEKIPTPKSDEEKILSEIFKITDNNPITDIEYNMICLYKTSKILSSSDISGIAGVLLEIDFGRIDSVVQISTSNESTTIILKNNKDEIFNIALDKENKIKQITNQTNNEYISFEYISPEATDEKVDKKTDEFRQDVVNLLEKWKQNGGHEEVVNAYNSHASEYGRSKMDNDDAWCSETVSAAYAYLGYADKIGGMASNGNTYEKNAREIGIWVDDKYYIPKQGDILITHDSNGDRHTACVVSCDGNEIKTIAGGGSKIHHGNISVGSNKITGYVVPE